MGDSLFLNDTLHCSTLVCGYWCLMVDFTVLLSNHGRSLACAFCFFMIIAEHLGVDLLALQEHGFGLLQLTLASMHLSNIVLTVVGRVRVVAPMRGKLDTE